MFLPIIRFRYISSKKSFLGLGICEFFWTLNLDLDLGIWDLDLVLTILQLLTSGQKKLWHDYENASYNTMNHKATIMIEFCTKEEATKVTTLILPTEI